MYFSSHIHSSLAIQPLSTHFCRLILGLNWSSVSNNYESQKSILVTHSLYCHSKSKRYNYTRWQLVFNAEREKETESEREQLTVPSFNSSAHLIMQSDEKNHESKRRNISLTFQILQIGTVNPTQDLSMLTWIRFFQPIC